MNPLFAKAIVLASALAVVVIPASIHRRDGDTQVLKNRKGPRERVLLTFTSIGFFLALLWVATPVLRFADYSLRPVPWVAGALCLAAGLWFLYRSHADLGSNWSVTLEVREKHQLVTHGVYRRVRHPMYLALLLYSVGLMLVLPNWVAGPSYLVAIAMLIALRVGPEERMMLEEFGKDYETYTRRTKRFVPGVW
jgi:protein-S-isoprenylcysteine O-methyltransferase Ste14